MSIQDDDRQFEQELRGFAPLEVVPLPARVKVGRRWVSAAIAAAVLVMLGVSLLWRPHKTANRKLTSNQMISLGPMTLGKSQAVLTQATSFDAAINELEREARLKEKGPVQGKHTAFEVLGREGL